jgi:hypothetical protein
MRWPWQRGSDVDSSEAKLALEREQKLRVKVEANEERVEQVADELAKHRRENHFARLVEEAMHIRRSSR